MEVLLNTIWLLVSIGAFLYWRPKKYKGTATVHDHSSTFGILALGCALVLLFPVISLTDDLNAEQFTMEDSSRTVMKARGLAQECLRASRSPFTTAVTTPPCSADPLNVFLGSVFLLETRVLCFPPISPHEGRAPPTLV